MKRIFSLLAVFLFVIMASCSSPKIGHKASAWEIHDLQLAQIGKARFIQCLAEPENFEACVEETAKLLDSWCQIYDSTESRACSVLDDIIGSS